MKLILSLLAGIFIMSITLTGCGTSVPELTFSELTGDAARYKDRTVTLEAFYFSGFEISALCGSVGPANDGVWRIVPKGELIWVEGGITQQMLDDMYKQTVSPSGYPEYIGKLKLTGEFETGAKYGHLDAYSYRIKISDAELLEWTPPGGG